MEQKQSNQKGGYLIGVVSLGCDKNRVDTETMMTYLHEDKRFEFTHDPSVADIIIINTCAFIQSARDESQDTIKEMIDYRRNGSCKCLVVTGCYPQKYLKDLTNKFPQVDVFLGTNEYSNIVDIISEYLQKEDDEQIIKTDSPHCLHEVKKTRLITTPSHYAYLKIADGCDNFCSYCTIPYIRGRFRSQKIETLVKEAKDLVEAGAKEIILVAQDTAKYGMDIYGEPKLHELLSKLSKINGLEWIRLLYCYPESITDELIREIATNGKVCKYIDVPFQHISDKILTKMNRKVNKEQIISLVEKLRIECPQIVIRTTFIVGFPQETKVEFKELLNFLKETKLENVGFFSYSREDGTVAARFDGQVDEITKHRRLLKAFGVQKKIIANFNKSLIGTDQQVIIEGYDDKKGLFVGRTQFQAPEIDTITYVSATKNLCLGDIITTTIVKAKGYYLFGVSE